MGNRTNAAEVTIANATLMTVLIEHLVKSGVISAEEREIIYQTSIDRLSEHHLASNMKAAAFLKSVIS